MQKLISILMCLCLILSTFTFVGITASAEEYKSGYYYYTVSEGEAEITNYSISISGMVTIPSTLGGYPVTSIGDSAFYNCKSLTGVTIPNSVTSIGGSAFIYCSSLASVTIPKNVKSIGSDAFYACSTLKSVNITDIKAWCEIKFDGEYSNPLLYANNLYLNGNLVKNLTIPIGVTSIGYVAFSGCTSLTSVTILDGVTSIGDYAFSGCTSLTSVAIPDSVISIGDSGFYNCLELTSVNITNLKSWCEIEFGDYRSNPLYYAKKLYLNNELLEGNLTIPQGVTSIGDYAFYECCSLTSVNIPNSVISIGNSAFKYCESLVKVFVPDSVTSIGTDAFKNIMIYCNQISYAETYAIKSGLNFHAHYLVVDKVVKATCTKTGLTEGKHCSTCGEVLVAQKTVKATGHKYKWTTTKKATYFAKGTSSYKCTVCGKVAKTKSIAKLVLKKPTVTYKTSSKKISIKYTKVSGATGFQVRYRLTNSKKWKTVTFKTSKSATKYIKNLKKNKKYYLQTRAYVQSGSKKAYSSWTTRKTIKVK